MPLKLLSPGGGSVLLQANTTSLDYTLTVPAQTGNIFTTTSNLTSTTFTGALPYGNMPTGSTLQVIQNSTSTTVSSTSLSYVDTNLSATITPKYSTSKILIMISQQCSWSHSSANGLGINLLRGSTTLHESIADATGPFESYSSSTNLYMRHNLTYLDSPISTSALTYKTQIRPYSAGTVAAQGSAGVTPGKSYIILMEIAG